jgi:site-specific DNA recombinase
VHNKLVDHRLVIDELEAVHVRATFVSFLRTGSVTRTIEKAEPWRRFDKAAMRLFLSSPVSAGLLRAGAEIVKGQHEAIVDREIWDAVQVKLTKRPPPGPRKVTRAPDAALLAGMLVCGACGSSMQRHYTSRHGRQYGYYTCSRAIKRGASSCPGSRVALADIEQHVVDRLLEICREPEILRATVDAARAEVVNRKPEIERELAELDTKRTGLVTERRTLAEQIGRGGSRALVERLGVVEDEFASTAQRETELRDELARLAEVRIDEEQLRTIGVTWDALYPAERNRLVRLLVQRVTFTPATRSIEVDLR